MTPYTLADAEERNREYPRTFHIPPKQLRENFKVGDVVKVIFEHDPTERGERMWVIIQERTEKDGKVSYRGELNNDPEVLADMLKCGDMVDFEPRHIINHYEKQPEYSPWIPKRWKH
jgi:hypothetical protein